MIQYCDDFLFINVAQSTLFIELTTQKTLFELETFEKTLKLTQNKASELSLFQITIDIEH